MAEPNPYEAPQSAPGRSRAPWVILAIGACLLLVLFVLMAGGFPKSWMFDYDTAAHADITRKIADYPKLRGKRFDDVSRELGLEDIPWDDINYQGLAPCLMYHFRGFALIVRLEYSWTERIPESSHKQFSADERLPFRERLRIHSRNRPSIWIDGISSREERMRQHNARVRAQEDETNREMDANEQRPRKS